MFITETTSREDLLKAIDSEESLFWAFVEADKDFVKMETNEIRDFITDWIEAGDECANC